MSDSEKPKSWKERKQSIKHKWSVPFVYVEWKCEQFSELLEQWAFLDILGHAGRLTIIVAVIFYIKGCPERQRQAVDNRKAKHYQAWQVINEAQGKLIGAGRKDALEDLNKDKVSLVCVDISKAQLPNLELENARLSQANISGAYLLGANFSGANLSDANFMEAQLPYMNLSRSYLLNANLSGVNLQNANLSGAILMDANLAGADLSWTDLSWANLSSTNLTGATLLGVNLSGANLVFANLENINFSSDSEIEHANIHGIRNPPNGFIKWATIKGAIDFEDSEEWEKFLSERRQE